MPILTNQRHEKFCQLVAGGMPASRAYTEAGYSCSSGSVDANASRLLKKDRVFNRVQELGEKTQSALIKLISVDKQWVIEQLIENARMAKEEGQIGPANRALELIGKELGMFVDRKDVSMTVTHEDALERLEALARGAGETNVYQ